MTFGKTIVLIVLFLSVVWASAYVIRTYPDHAAKIEKERADIQNAR